ncbi:C40 family peptidase [Allokutzneria sp. A3M-2-11 16]|uniref:C40 family peptidase n=1 Tax=Allokutzneria sp. A3M-2-11 16 TaxID=2962043 RepID=UPI0020B8C7CF|nr:NlpC/P60 family protein [Allokutzneria sp. A3M-2-11 16]MCP3802029.1 C40 family peptidase [Allokutzneria sp. A3M-2-11 16]
MSRTTKVVRTAAVATTIGLAFWGVVHFVSEVAGAHDPAPEPVAAEHDAKPSGAVGYERLRGPDRTVVRDAAGAVVMTLTDGARTVTVTGPQRTFTEPAFTAAAVVTTTWVRLLPTAWRAGAETEPWFTPWFTKARDTSEPDMFAIAMGYIEGARARRDAKGVRFQGDAAFGPVASSGAGRLERSDFIDYLGTPWTFGDGVKRKPDPARYGAVDCSGFVRLVYGYRMGYPLLSGNTSGPGLPRRAYAMAKYSPGTLLVADTKSTATAHSRLQPGDLVFFEAEDSDAQLDHVGIYLGIDTNRQHRFISSRERANGPTLGDFGGTSLLDDNGHYSRAWRAARRI